MSSDNAVTAGAYAAVIAASHVVASRGVASVGARSTAEGRRLKVATRADIPRLLAATLKGDNVEHRIARATAAALLYARNAKPDEIGRFLSPEECSALGKVDEVWRNSKAKPWKQGAEYVHCRYCALLAAALYKAKPNGPPGPIVVSHSAVVAAGCDPDTNISQAEITGFKMLMPKALAIQTILASHPLEWKRSAPALFKRACPANQLESDWEPDEGMGRVDWEKRAASRAYLWEDATYAWNDLTGAELNNVIRITDFAQQGLPGSYSEMNERGLFPPIRGNEGQTLCAPSRKAQVSLQYRYSLESCLLTLLGTAWERGGLDVDAGYYCGKAYDLNDLDEQDEPFKNLTVGDLRQLGSTAPEAKADPKDDEKVPARRAFAAVKEAGKRVGQDVWLTEVSSSKRLRFTAPGGTPVGLWSALTSMAPTLLFAFLNRAVCQTVHHEALGAGGTTGGAPAVASDDEPDRGPQGPPARAVSYVNELAGASQPAAKRVR
jgi:hypothetical protein